MNLKRALLTAAAVAILPASAFAQTAASNFATTVSFTPDTGATTDVMISCNGGVPLEQQKTGLGDGDNVTFVVDEMPAGTNCTITGDDVAGFTAEYVFDGGPSADGCTFEAIDAGFQGACDIEYTASDVAFTVSKTWNVEGDGGDALDASYTVRIMCSAEITSATGAVISMPDEGEWMATWAVSGTTDRTFTANVDATGDVAPACWATESVLDSAVESAAASCGRPQSIPVGGTAGCSIVNTVFYEGIPTLSQYGLAVMALLMLGVGFIGFRRFV